jgi:TetR/AcrR family transcriptional regulator
MSYVAVRREEEKERRRAEMVDAAEALYAKVGWDAVTMDRVAKSARLSRALLYVYFRDKNDLLHAITERALHYLR